MSDVQPYAFGQAAAEPAAGLVGLDKQGERLARLLRGIIEPFCGGKPGVTAQPIDNTMFMMWDACVPSFVSLSVYRIAPIKGPVALRIDAALVSQLVDRFYGGRGPSHATERAEFTPTEARLLNRLASQIVDALVASWSDIARLEPLLIARETGVAQADILAADANIVVQSFEVDLGIKEKFLIEIIYPQDGLAGIEVPQGTRRTEEPRLKDPIWQARLAKRLEQVRLPVKTVLARPNLRMSELMALKPGDVIPIQIARHLPLIVGDRVYAHGTIGEQDGVAAFMIEKLA